MSLELRQREMAPLQISQHSIESCPIAKSPRGSPNPPQPLKRAKMKLLSKQRELKRAKSQSHRLLARHWLDAKEQSTGTGRWSCSWWTDSRLGRGWRAGRKKLYIWAHNHLPQGNRAARSSPWSLPMAFHTRRHPGNVSATMARGLGSGTACACVASAGRGNLPRWWNPTQIPSQKQTAMLNHLLVTNHLAGREPRVLPAVKHDQSMQDAGLWKGGAEIEEKHPVNLNTTILTLWALDTLGLQPACGTCELVLWTWSSVPLCVYSESLSSTGGRVAVLALVCPSCGRLSHAWSLQVWTQTMARLSLEALQPESNWTGRSSSAFCSAFFFTHRSFSVL